MHDEPEYMCHFCNTPIVEDDIEHMTEYNGQELYFCSKRCLFEWDGIYESAYDEDTDY